MRIEKIVWVLLFVSLLMYGLDYIIFRRGNEIAFGFVGNLAFLPVYVLFVTVMIEQVFKEREREAIRQKLNMVIGVFFSEVGTKLLRDCFGFVINCTALPSRLKVTTHWTEHDFKNAADYLQTHDIALDSRHGDLPALKLFLIEKKEFMLTLLENPNLLEHNAFTDLLWAVFHLIEELDARKSLIGLPSTDMDHLSGDIKRAYVNLLREWVVYMSHLHKDYPYLFSLAVRTNPMNPDAKVEIS